VCDSSRNFGGSGRACLSEGGRELSEPEWTVQQREVQRCVRQAVANLEGEEREFAELLLAGWKLREIAEKLGIHYESARRRWHKVQKKLQVQLRAFED
jgi:RNA polymerase sigma factor (sigma-70 family)